MQIYSANLIAILTLRPSRCEVINNQVYNVLVDEVTAQLGWSQMCRASNHAQAIDALTVAGEWTRHLPLCAHGKYKHWSQSCARQVRTSGGVEESDLVPGADVPRGSDDQITHIQVDEGIAAVIHEHLQTQIGALVKDLSSRVNVEPAPW